MGGGGGGGEEWGVDSYLIYNAQTAAKSEGHFRAKHIYGLTLIPVDDTRHV